MVTVLLFLLCDLAPAQTEGAGPDIDLVHTFSDGSVLRQVERRVSHPVIRSETAVGAVATSRTAFAVAHEGDHPRFGALSLCRRPDAWSCQTVVKVGQPAWPQFTPDGTRLTYFAVVDGVMALFVYELSTGTTRQLTNYDLVRRPGQAPSGHIPGPRDGRYTLDDRQADWADTVVVLP